MLSWYTCGLLTLIVARWTEAGLGNYPDGPESQAELVEQLRLFGHIKTDIVAQVMTAIDRKNYFSNSTYQDEYNYTNFDFIDSPPYMHAFVLEQLHDVLLEGHTALDVGSASGYLTACMAAMVGPTGRVVGIEHLPHLVQHARECVARDPYLVKFNINVKFVEGNERFGVPEDGPYDAISVAFATEFIPYKLIKLLKRKGRMVVKLGAAGHVDEMTIFDKLEDGMVIENTEIGDFCVNRFWFDRKLEKGPDENETTTTR